MSITLEQARTIIYGAKAHAREQELAPLAIAELDAGGHLTAFEREDGAANMRFQMGAALLEGRAGLAG